MLRPRTIFLSSLLLFIFMALDSASKSTKREDRGKSSPLTFKAVAREGSGSQKVVGGYGSKEAGLSLSKEEITAKRDQVRGLWSQIKESGAPLGKSDLVALYAAAGAPSLLQTFLDDEIDGEEYGQIASLRRDLHEEAIHSLVKSKKFGDSVGVYGFIASSPPSFRDAPNDIDCTLYNRQGASGEEMAEAYEEEFRHITTREYGREIAPRSAGIVVRGAETATPDWCEATEHSRFALRIAKEKAAISSHRESYTLEGAYLEGERRKKSCPEAKIFTWYSLEEGDNISERKVSGALQKELFSPPDAKRRYAHAAALSSWHLFHARGSDHVAAAKELLQSVEESVALDYPEAVRERVSTLDSEKRRDLIDRYYSGKLSPLLLRRAHATLETAVALQHLKKERELDIITIEGQMRAYRPLIDEIIEENSAVVLSDEELVNEAKARFVKVANAIMIENNNRNAPAEEKEWLTPPLMAGESLRGVDSDGDPAAFPIGSGVIKRLYPSAFFELYSALSLEENLLLETTMKNNPKFKTVIEESLAIGNLKQKMLSARDGLPPQRVLDWKITHAKALQEKIDKLVEHLQTNGYDKESYEEAMGEWSVEQHFAPWIEGAMREALRNVAGGAPYLPFFRKLCCEMRKEEQQLLTPSWLMHLPKAAALFELLDIYSEEGEIGDRVMQTALYQRFNDIPAINSLYIAKSPLNAKGRITLANAIPGIGELTLDLDCGRGCEEGAASVELDPIGYKRALLANRGGRGGESSGWSFNRRNKERIEAVEPSLLDAVDPDGELSFDKRRERVYDFFHRKVLEKMESNPEIWYDEYDMAEQWQREEFAALTPLVEAHVDAWWHGNGFVSDGEGVDKGDEETLRRDLVTLLQRDYIRGKNIALQKMIVERESKEKVLEALYYDIAAKEYALKRGGEGFRSDYKELAELIPALALQEMPTVTPSLEIFSAEEGASDREEEQLIEKVNLCAKVRASTKEHPAPWKFQWSVHNRGCGEVLFSPGEKREIEAAKGLLTVTVRAIDAEGGEIASAAIPLAVEEMRCKEAGCEEKKNEEVEVREAEDQPLSVATEITPPLLAAEKLPEEIDEKEQRGSIFLLLEKVREIAALSQPYR